MNPLLLRKKLTIVMPAYNEKNTVRQAIEETKFADIGNFDKEIIAVDDGSADGTANIINEIDGIKKILLPKNRGKGGALKEGIKQATGEYVVFHDADLEYKPTDFKYMLPILESGLSDVVIGTRFKGRKQHFFGKNKNVILANYIGNLLLRIVWNVLYRDNLTDIYPCYKVMRLKDLRELELKEDRFVFDLELILKLRKAGKVFTEVPIHFEHRSYAQGKKIGVKDGLASLWYLVKNRFFDG